MRLEGLSSLLLDGKDPELCDSLHYFHLYLTNIYAFLIQELLSQITPTISHFQSLQRLEIFNSKNGFSSSCADYDDLPEPCSPIDLQEGIALERGLVEQWSRMCPKLSYIEFTSQRVWKAS